MFANVWAMASLRWFRHKVSKKILNIGCARGFSEGKSSKQ